MFADAGGLGWCNESEALGANTNGLLKLTKLGFVSHSTYEHEKLALVVLSEANGASS